MFKKKPDIPPRPKIPTVEQIVEDIDHATSDDNVFQKTFVGEARQDGSTHQIDADTVYNKVKDFVDVNVSLKDLLQKLQGQNEALKISDLELKAMAEDIRKQALDALQ